MMTQSVMTQAANLFGNAAGSVTTKGKQSATDFGQLMQGISSPNESTAGSKTAVRNTEKKLNNVSDKSRTAKNQTGTQETDSVKDTQEVKSTERESATESNKTQATKDTKVRQATGQRTEETGEDTEKTVKQMTSQLLELLMSIQKAVMEELNLTSEELDGLMEQEGMGMADLLNPENLQQLVLANNGETNILAALTDEGLADSMNQLLQTTEELKSMTGLTLTKEQALAMIAKAKDMGLLEPERLAELQSDQGVTDSLKEDLLRPQEDEAQHQTVEVKSEDQAGDDGLNYLAKNQTNNNTSNEIINPAYLKESDSNEKGQSEMGEQADEASAQEFLSFVDKLVQVSQETRTEFSGTLVQETQLKEIAGQIIEKIRILVKPGQSTMELQLNPEHLGKVQLSVQSRDGVMTAQFTVQNEISKEAIESQLGTLKDTLNQQGIKVEAIEVTVTSYNFEQNNRNGGENQPEAEDKSVGRKITLEEAMTMTEVPEQESITEDVTGIRGNRIDFTA